MIPNYLEELKKIQEGKYPNHKENLLNGYKHFFNTEDEFIDPSIYLNPNYRISQDNINNRFNVYALLKTSEIEGEIKYYLQYFSIDPNGITKELVKANIDDLPALIFYLTNRNDELIPIIKEYLKKPFLLWKEQIINELDNLNNEKSMKLSNGEALKWKLNTKTKAQRKKDNKRIFIIIDNYLKILEGINENNVNAFLFFYYYLHLFIKDIELDKPYIEFINKLEELKEKTFYFSFTDPKTPAKYIDEKDIQELKEAVDDNEFQILFNQITGFNPNPNELVSYSKVNNSSFAIASMFSNPTNKIGKYDKPRIEKFISQRKRYTEQIELLNTTIDEYKEIKDPNKKEALKGRITELENKLEKLKIYFYILGRNIFPPKTEIEGEDINKYEFNENTQNTTSFISGYPINEHTKILLINIPNKEKGKIIRDEFNTLDSKLTNLENSIQKTFIKIETNINNVINVSYKNYDNYILEAIADIKEFKIDELDNLEIIKKKIIHLKNDIKDNELLKNSLDEEFRSLETDILEYETIKSQIYTMITKKLTKKDYESNFPLFYRLETELINIRSDYIMEDFKLNNKTTSERIAPELTSLWNIIIMKLSNTPTHNGNINLSNEEIANQLFNSDYATENKDNKIYFNRKIEFLKKILSEYRLTAGIDFHYLKNSEKPYSKYIEELDKKIKKEKKIPKTKEIIFFNELKLIDIPKTIINNNERYSPQILVNLYIANCLNNLIGYKIPASNKELSPQAQNLDTIFRVKSRYNKNKKGHNEESFNINQARALTGKRPLEEENTDHKKRELENTLKPYREIEIYQQKHKEDSYKLDLTDNERIKIIFNKDK